MSGVIKFYAKGLPKGQPRPRAFAINGRARVFDPGTAEGWKQQVAIAAESHLPESPLAGALGVKIVFNMPRPKSHYRTGKNIGQLRQDAPWFYTSKPDIDNLVKAVFDALTTIRLWGDDCQIVSSEIQKHYAATGQEGASSEVFTMEGSKVAEREQTKPQHDWDGLKANLKQGPVKREKPKKPVKQPELMPVPGDGKTLFIANHNGHDSVFRRDPVGATFLHVADSHDLQTLPRGNQSP